jgi:phosphoglycolate phosphatase-like HAD superfamily hydrolase
MKDFCIIFDIDGTLVETVTVDDRLYGDAVRAILGDVVLRERWSKYSHISDAGILREVCVDNALPFDDIHQSVRTRFGELFRAELDHRPCRPLNGALQCFQSLNTRSDVDIGIATGGWGHTARMKIESAGFDTRDVPFASSDDHHVRTSIMSHCRQQMPASDVTVYVGDGEWDMKAAAELGWRFVGVGERLQGRCEKWVADLSVSNLMQIIQGPAR